MKMELGKCPNCGQSLRGCYDLQPTIENDEEFSFGYQCKSCHTFGKEFYKYHFFGHYNITDENGAGLISELD